MLIVFFWSTYKYQIYDWFILLDLIFFKNQLMHVVHTD